MRWPWSACGFNCSFKSITRSDFQSRTLLIDTHGPDSQVPRANTESGEGPVSRGYIAPTRLNIIVVVAVARDFDPYAVWYLAGDWLVSRGADLSDLFRKARQRSFNRS
jgi:hypothetical protein